MTSAGPGSSAGPTAVRILLGSRLRRAREAAGITPAAAGHEIRASASKMSRLELGRVGFKHRDVADLLTLYSITEEQGLGEERTRLLALAADANRMGWWHTHADVLPSWFEAYVGLEEAATLIRTYEVQFVPGLLQTADYAAAVTAAAFPEGAEETVAERVAVRMERQKLLARPDPPHVWAVVDEAALRRPLGGRDVMAAQLEHLLEIKDLPNVTLQVMPFRFGSHAAEGGAFTILRFAEDDLPDLVYLESLTGAAYLDEPDDVDRYVKAADRLAVDASDPEASAQLIERILADTRADT